MRIRHKLWIEDDAGVLFGQGRLELFRTLDELGSLSAAAKKLGMSYRAAWGRLKASEERMGVPLTEQAATGRGLILNDRGKELVASYADFEERANKALEKAGRAVFGPDVTVLPSRDEVE